MKISKDIWAIAAGPAVGVIFPVFLKQYIEPTYGTTVPGIDGFIPAPWCNWSVFWPTLLGAVSIGAVAFYKNKKFTKTYKDFATTFGVTSLITGIIGGIFGTGGGVARATARAPVRLQRTRRIARAATQMTNGLTPTGISGKVILA